MKYLKSKYFRIAWYTLAIVAAQIMLHQEWISKKWIYYFCGVVIIFSFGYEIYMKIKQKKEMAKICEDSDEL